MKIDLASAVMLMVMLVAVIGLVGLANSVFTGSATMIRLPQSCMAAGLDDAYSPNVKPTCCGCPGAGDVVFCYPSLGSVPQFDQIGDANADGMLDIRDCD